MTTETDRLNRLEARLDAMSATIKTVLTTLVMRGTLTKAAVAEILRESEAALAHAPEAVKEVASVREDMPNYLLKARGPMGEDDEHGGH